MQKFIVGTIFFLLVALILYLYMEISIIRSYMMTKIEATPDEKSIVEVEGDGLT